ncbi:MAG: PQQ-dependent sugar dehydrogenase [Bacteroidota bacterium]|nr:PQQ-dependent sugar dehydrogenase [Bacteroidota bacterium]
MLLVSCKKSSTRENYIQSADSGSSGIKVELVADNLYVPWSIVFTDAHRMLVTERNGKLRVITDGKLEEKPLKVFEDISATGEEGLMGVALDPDYRTNKLLYVSYAYGSGENMNVKVARYKDEGDHLIDDMTLIDHIPASHLHAGCRIHFGPDGKLYISTGDATERQRAQDLHSLNGKILRLNSDGSIPADNPFPNSPIWTYGNRNPQGFDWYPDTDILWETEHGPSGFDGPGGGDEVNLIEKGKNYGWPVIHHRETKEGMVSPVLEFTPALAPASGMFYRSGVIPEFKNNFFFGCLRGSGIMRVIMDPKDPRKIISYEMLKEVDFGRIRDVAEGPDGAIYFSTSNRDGRGELRKGDDKIYRIVRQ